MDEAEQEAAAAEAQRKLDEEKVVADKAAKAKWRADRKVGTSSTVRAFVRVPYECVLGSYCGSRRVHYYPHPCPSPIGWGW